MSMDRASGKRRADGWACVAGGLTLSGCSYWVHRAAHGGLDADTERLTNVVATLSVLGLMCGVVRLAALLTSRTGRAPKLTTTLAMAGLSIWMVSTVFTAVTARTLLPLGPLGSATLTAGLLPLGVRAARAGVFRGLWRLVPVLPGSWFLVQFPIQFALFISQGSRPSYLLLLGVWGVLWALLGCALLVPGAVTQAPRRQRLVAA